MDPPENDMPAGLLASRPVLRFGLPIAIGAALAVIAVDQLSKHLVVDMMNLREAGEIDVFPGFAFRMAWNTGVNFGLLGGGGDAARLLLGGGATLLGVILIVSSMACRSMPSAIGIGVAGGGAIGNAIDRFNWGAVADFLNVSCCGLRNPWSFNIADIAVFVGFALLFLPRRGASRE